MQEIQRKYIDWGKTAINLRLLRNDNLNLRRYVCMVLNRNSGDCDGACDNCKFDMDNSISRGELAKVFNVSESCVVNWERGTSRPTLDDLIFYSEICNINLYDVVVFENQKEL